LGLRLVRYSTSEYKNLKDTILFILRLKSIIALPSLARGFV